MSMGHRRTLRQVICLSSLCGYIYSDYVRLQYSCSAAAGAATTLKEVRVEDQ
jgi:hypothetical protein